MKKILSTAIACILLVSSSYACSALFLKRNHNFLGKNFDWDNGEGMIIKNNRGVEKTAYGLDEKNVVKWVSKYGSVTFNQVGKEFPYGGINERGLAIEMLWMSNAYYEENGQASLSELEWIQYQLDNYKTAAEVQYFLDSVSINPVMANLHYIVADRGGRSFVVDFVNGKAVISNSDKDYQVVTNSNYKGSVNYYEKHKDSINSESRSSIDRFCQLSSKAEPREINSVEKMFRVMKESAEDRGEYKTYWTLVYDLYNYRVLIKTQDSKQTKKIELRQLDFTQLSPVLGMDINADFVSWGFYTSEMNKNLLTRTMEKSKVKLNLEMVNKHMMHPAKFMMDDTYFLHYKDLKINFDHKVQKGAIFYTVTQGEENFKKYKGVKSAVLSAKPDEVKAVFYSMPIGEYAVAAFHDLNGNSKMDTFLGIPKEPYAFSNNASGFFSPPGYKKAKFNLKEKSVVNIKIK